MRTAILSLLLAVFSVSLAAAQTLSGNRVSRNFPVASFDALKVNGVVELNLVQGDKEGVTVDADENLQGYVTIANNGNTLEIDTKKLNNQQIKGNWKLYVTVHFRNINSLKVGTVGHVKNEGTLKMDNLKLDVSSVGNTSLRMDVQKLNLNSSSVGNIELAGSAKSAVMRNSSVGNLRAEGLKVGTLELHNSGIGNADINADNIASFQGSMLGKVRNKGQKLKSTPDWQ